MKTSAKITLLSLLVLPLLAMMPAAEPSRIVTCDMQKVLDGYYRRQQAKKAFETSQLKIDQDLKARVTELEKIKAEYLKIDDSVKDTTITPKEKESREKKALEKLQEFNVHKQEFENYQAQALEKLRMDWQRVEEGFEDTVNDAVKARAKAAGYSLVLNSSKDKLRMLPPLVLYTSGENDITDEILKQLNAAAPAEAKK